MFLKKPLAKKFAFNFAQAHRKPTSWCIHWRCEHQNKRR